jgi:hypothetical protein
VVEQEGLGPGPVLSIQEIHKAKKERDVKAVAEYLVGTRSSVLVHEAMGVGVGAGVDDAGADAAADADADFVGVSVEEEDVDEHAGEDEYVNESVDADEVMGSLAHSSMLVMVTSYTVAL